MSEALSLPTTTNCTWGLKAIKPAYYASAGSHKFIRIKPING